MRPKPTRLPRPSITRETARPTSRASQRKLTSAMAPPPATPAATGAPPTHHAPPLITATVQAPTHVTREVSSVAAIRLIHPVQRLDGAVEIHAGRRDTEPKPNQQEPRLRPQPPIREIPDAQPDCDTREEHGAETDELRGVSG